MMMMMMMMMMMTVLLRLNRMLKEINVWSNKMYVRFEVFRAVTMKNVVFWDIKTQFVLHRRHITSSLQSAAG
jgi:hypothetical protein